MKNQTLANLYLVFADNQKYALISKPAGRTTAKQWRRFLREAGQADLLIEKTKDYYLNNQRRVYLKQSSTNQTTLHTVGGIDKTFTSKAYHNLPQIDLFN